ncbi:excinuclease ABC subunit UvrA [bacterium]|nr:excinuclease ABC subunit UvrA [bacterium]
MNHQIAVRGARTHNLQGIDVAIPHGQFTVVTGVSGSGKSSLAFDTLYSEGQRLYVESMSAYARQFLERMPRPPVDHISGMLPSIALEQKNTVANARSTVGTATEINDFLRLLFANVGRTACPDCGLEAERHSPETAVRFLEGLPEGTRFLVVAPLAIESKRRLKFLRQSLAEAGFRRVLHRGQVCDLADVSDRALAEADILEVVVDRLVKRTDRLSRAADSIELAFRVSSHGAVLDEVDAEGRPVERHHFFAGLVCRSCGREFPEPQPGMFSFNSGIGACPTCEGFGKEADIDVGKVLPYRGLSLEDHAVAAWATPAYREVHEWMLRKATAAGVPADVPYHKLSAAHRRWVLEGDGDFVGVRGFFAWLETKKYKVQNRIMVARYRRYVTCSACDGTRLKPEAQHVRLGGRSFTDLQVLPVPELHRFFHDLKLSPPDEEAARSLRREIHGRLEYLEGVGLAYVTLDRETRTLSGGEAQRIHLASALGSSLTNTLYVLDEPTVGLHALDTHRLLDILRALTDKGNTVVCVEHDPEIIEGADRVIDLGPGAGEHGGRVVFDGTPAALRQAGTSKTADQLRGRLALPSTPRGRKPTRFITIRGAEQHNLKGLDVRIPLGVLACVTGVSGAGKSTLVNSTLYANYRRRKGNARLEPGRVRSIAGLQQIGDMILVDQTPLGRSTRSNAATYTKAYDDIRRLFAATRRARTLGIEARDFSFNVPGGRCETCQGVGTQTIDMQFLADVTVTCEQCGGRRFQKRVLEVTLDGHTILDVLDLTVAEATTFFADTPTLVAKLRPLADVGLGYLRLGQSTATLSGGEAQRLKLASYLSKAIGKTVRARDGILFLFNEPTVGLHMADVHVLMGVLQRLVDEGHSVLVVEHNLDVVRQADWVIDLGPGGGDAGGELVAEGPPEAIMACERSVTGRFLGRQTAAPC